MKKFFFLIFILLFSIYGYSSSINATINEVKNSINEVEKAVKDGKEDLVKIFSSALEIEKRAITPFYAEIIMKKICKNLKISEQEFQKLRNQHSFFDISIGYAISRVTGTSIDEIMKLKQQNPWEKIVEKYSCSKEYCNAENIVKYIEELNPKK